MPLSQGVAIIGLLAGLALVGLILIGMSQWTTISVRGAGQGRLTPAAS
jgi:hypothetical protein